MEIDIKPHEKQLIENIQIPDNKVIEDSDYFFRKRIERLFAVSVTFRGVSFKQSEINKCYFRKCNFDSCDFTGASVSSSNFQSSKFTACKFQYATFDKTFIGFDILKKNLPAEENLKAALARSLRVNYLGLGIYDGVNLAIDTEIKATLEHYHKAAFSSESYYRNKYTGLLRWKMVGCYFYEFLSNKIWGCGEKPLNLIFSSVSFILLLALFEVLILQNQANFSSVVLAVTKIFLAIDPELQVSDPVKILLVLSRYVVMGLFVASLVRRQSRR